MNPLELPLLLVLTKLLFQIKNLSLTRLKQARVKAKVKVKKVNAKSKTEHLLYKEQFKSPRKVNGKNKDNTKHVNKVNAHQKFNKEKV